MIAPDDPRHSLLPVGSANVRDTMPEARAFQVVRHVLEVAEQRLGAPVLILGLQEWKWAAPKLPAGYRFVRSKGGGSPFVYDGRRLQLDSIEAVQLAPEQYVGHLEGRKSNLKASIATVARWHLTDVDQANKITGTGFHLTAEVQKGQRYRIDAEHALRVARHKHERHALTHELSHQDVRRFAVGDSNFDGMKLPPLVACWVGHDKAEAEGTLGSRSPDYVYADGRARQVITIADASDHDAVVATYPRNH